MDYKERKKLQKQFPDAIIVSGTSATYGVGNFENAISKFDVNGKVIGIEKHDPKKPKLIIPLDYLNFV